MFLADTPGALDWSFELNEEEVRWSLLGEGDLLLNGLVNPRVFCVALLVEIGRFLYFGYWLW